jgi:hypothetical protein
VAVPEPPWRHRPLLTLAFLAALALAAGLGVRAVLHLAAWRRMPEVPAIEGWMTPGYVARAWGIDRAEMARALGVTPTPGHPRTLAQIAAEKETTVEALAAAIRALRPDPPGAEPAP